MTDLDDLVRDRLRALRRHRGWSLDDLAQRTGVGASSISRIETGHRSISLDVVVPLARELGIAIDELVTSDQDDDIVIRPEPSFTDAMTFWSLSRPGSSVSAYKMRFEPTDTPPPQQVHPGRDWIFVIEGTLILHLADRNVLVQAGESAEFSTMTPHAASALHGPAELIGIFDRHGEQAHIHTH